MSKNIATSLDHCQHNNKHFSTTKLSKFVIWWSLNLEPLSYVGYYASGYINV